MECGWLTIVAPFRSRRVEGDGAARFELTRKFVAGIVEYQKRWGPRVRVLVERTQERDDNLDQQMWDAGELPFPVYFVDFEDAGIREKLSGSGMVLLAVHYRQMHLAAVCRELGVPCVYVSEYSLKTRLQILSAARLNPLVRARRALWEWQQEKKTRRAVAMADGVQCNGTPTFNAYKGLSQSPLLYFDTRTSAAMLAQEEDVRARAARNAGAPIQLAFSGRLIPMKGADDLVRVAQHLKRRGVTFELSIFGGGSLEGEMKEQVLAQGLGDVVRFHGTLDFQTELLPYLRRHIDLFVCCHRQGDPSCTYLETMSCGIPIAGYDNEAFVGVHEASGCGWTSPMNRPALLAEKIAAIAGDQEERLRQSVRSLAFASQHTFESTFDRRMSHLMELVKPPAGVAASSISDADAPSPVESAA